ncbi:hypothetical protein EXU57_02025 [Segetibacter sp. 3557_3]|uniref:hypothetical protein n=1 Tax=Segetibacter sp. 3557_3 TaxID=2547429 RepID=UPI001058C600|nr:hypothetical protein [Segetibacter sp. 3557_3]TDH28873.1 hypothetical protein EXU57_02025 [Segetibacter sp. 3557_3]
MNIINKFFLVVVLLPTRLYSRMGIDTHQLRNILRIKLVMDDRRPNTFQQSRRENAREVSSATLGTMGVSALLGLLSLGGFFVGSDYLTHLTIYYAFYIFLLSSTLISDFTSVLIDVRDNYILLPKPVNDRTFVTARLLHITVHICKLIVPMNLPAVIYMGVKTGIWSATVFLLVAIMVTLFTIFLINALYLLIIRITTPQKFQGIISYIQIFFAIFVFAGYQSLPRLVDKMDLAAFHLSSSPLMWFIPPYWFAGGWQCLTEGDTSTSALVAAFVTFSLPFISIWLVVKYFAPSFNRKLSMISGSEEVATAKPSILVPGDGFSIPHRLARWVTKPGAERMAFEFCWKMTGRSRDFKMKVYPSFGYILVYFVMMFTNKRNFSLTDLSEETQSGRMVIVSVLYFSSFMLMMAINQVVYSEKFKAAWIFFSTPVKYPGSIMSGAVKSAMLKFYIPVLVLITIPALALVGVKIIPNLLLGLFNELLICSTLAYISIQHLPFSLQQGNNGKAGNFFRGTAMLIIPGIIGLIHYFIYPHLWIVSILCVFSVVGTGLAIKAIEHKRWKAVLKKYDE